MPTFSAQNITDITANFTAGIQGLVDLLVSVSPLLIMIGFAYFGLRFIIRIVKGKNIESGAVAWKDSISAKHMYGYYLNKSKTPFNTKRLKYFQKIAKNGKGNLEDYKKFKAENPNKKLGTNIKYKPNKNKSFNYINRKSANANGFKTAKSANTFAKKVVAENKAGGLIIDKGYSDWLDNL